MAMTDQQQSGWSAGTGSSLAPDDLNLLILGSLATVLILFYAWSVVQAYRGLSTQAVSGDSFRSS
jgi:integrating conjugative element protein (TIGR03758 family)